jgi:hypothetical protein
MKSVFDIFSLQRKEAISRPLYVVAKPRRLATQKNQSKKTD